jgi:hypothetical protein
MAIKTWTGAGANNNWNTALNWSGGTIPITGDDIVFDGVFPLTGNKNCTYNVSISVASINFTGYLDTLVAPYNGQFTFSNDLTVTGNITLGAGTTYLTSGTVTSFTLRTNNTILTSNGKSLPLNILLVNPATLTVSGNADFQGNYIGNNTGHGLRGLAGTTPNLRIGGNITLGAVTTNATDYVTIKGYGTAKTFAANSAAINQRVSFVAGSTYTSTGVGNSGACYYTVESGGQFNSFSTTSTSSTGGGNLYLSGFNSSNNSDYLNFQGSGSIVLLDDTVVKGFVNITTSSFFISTSVGAKLLLEGNFTASSSATTTIDYLEFSGTTLSTVSAVTSGGNLQIKNLSFNKTGAGSVNFTSTAFTLYIPSATTYTWTHTAGIITQAVTSVVRFFFQSTTSTVSYSESGTLTTPFTFNSLQLSIGILQLNSLLRATTITLLSSMTFTGTAGWTCGTWLCSVPGALIILQSGITYTTTTNVTMLGTNASKITIRSNAPTVSYAIWTLQNPATQSMVYVNGQGVNSNAGMSIYSFGGTILTSLPALNWYNGASQGTKAFTYVS